MVIGLSMYHQGEKSRNEMVILAEEYHQILKSHEGEVILAKSRNNADLTMKRK
ncbi:MAG: hypothetical protein ACOYBD_04045 [Bilifractor sp.]|jgi:hypothetical protein